MGGVEVGSKDGLVELGLHGLHKSRSIFRFATGRLLGILNPPAKTKRSVVGRVYNSQAKDGGGGSDDHVRDRRSTDVYGLRANLTTRAELTRIVGDVEHLVLYLFPAAALARIIDAVLAEIRLDEVLR